MAVAALPSREELAAWYELLGRDPHEVDEAGGMEPLSSAAGITSIRSAAGAPEPATGEEVADHLLGLADWVGTVAEEPSAPEVTELELAAEETAEQLYERLRELSDRIGADGTVRSTFFRRAAWLVDELPVQEQARFGRLIIDRLQQDPFAERFAGHLNDLALATLTVTVARHERLDASDLARDVGRTAERHGTLLRLVDAVSQSLADLEDAHRLRRHGGHEQVGPLQAAVDPAVLSSVSAAISEEDRELAESFPLEVEQGRALALVTLVDVFLAGPREEQLPRLLDNVTLRLREAVVRGDAALVGEVMAALERGVQVASPEVRAAIERAWAQTLTGQVVADAAVSLAREGSRLQARVLEPFGAAAIGPVVRSLGEDVGDAIKEELSHLLGEVAEGHRALLHDQVSRQRPDVIAQLLPVVARADDPSAQALLARLASRSEPELLLAVVDVLERQPPVTAASTVAGVARRAAAPEVRRRSLEVLAGLGEPGREELQALGSGRAEPRLPFRWRWTARRLLHRARRPG